MEPETNTRSAESLDDALHDPLAQRLLASSEPACLGYVWHDGTPRVVPMWFHWTGERMVFGSAARAPKVDALRGRPAVSVSIDTSGFPADVLLLRGDATVEMLDDVAPEYEASARRYLGDGAEGWLSMVRGQPMARVTVAPTWAEVYDFRTSFPQALSM